MNSMPSAQPLSAAMRWAMEMASLGSMAMTRRAPICIAITANTPTPVPISTTTSPGLIAARSAAGGRRHVVDPKSFLRRTTGRSWMCFRGEGRVVHSVVEHQRAAQDSDARMLCVNDEANHESRARCVDRLRHSRLCRGGPLRQRRNAIAPLPGRESTSLMSLPGPRLTRSIASGRCSSCRLE